MLVSLINETWLLCSTIYWWLPEDYVDNSVVKSKDVFTHVKNMRKVFIRYKKYKLRMHLLKCAFSVSFEKSFRIHYPQEKISISIQVKLMLFKIWSLPWLLSSQRVSWEEFPVCVHFFEPWSTPQAVSQVAQNKCTIPVGWAPES